MDNRKVSFFDAIGMPKPSPAEPLKHSDRRLNVKIIPVWNAYGTPQAGHRFQAAEIVAAWNRILGVKLDSETTAKHLVRLEQWSDRKKGMKMMRAGRPVSDN
jgi:hypothetical protein